MLNETLHIGLAGDVMIGRSVNTAIANRGYHSIWGNLLPLLCSTDLNIVNLETTLTNSKHKIFKTFNFKASPGTVRSLTEANISIVNLANNHILDFAEEGLLETLSTLCGAGIKFAGAGKNIQEASAPIIFTKNNITIGFLGLTDNEAEWKAGPFTCGVNYIDIDDKKDRERTLLSLEKLQERTNLVIVSIHWGPNMKKFPSNQFIEFAHQMLEHGATIIHGHSAHNFQGIEVMDRKLIFYDTGNFIDDYRVDPEFRNDHSFFYRVEVDKNGITKAGLVPVLIFDYRVNLATGDAYCWSLQRMKKLSAQFSTTVSDTGEILLAEKHVIE